MHPLIAVLIVLLVASVAQARVFVYQTPMTTDIVVVQEWSAPVYGYRPYAYRSSWPAPAYFGRPSYAYVMAGPPVVYVQPPGLMTRAWRALFGR